jgi:parallel beta-helix repeat protein
MKGKKYLMRCLAGILVIPAFVMCTKTVNPIAKPVNPNPDNNTEVPDNDTGAIPDCTYTVKTSDWVVDGANLPAGSVICIPAGTRGALLLKNLKGTAAKPIIIVNKGGRVTFSVAITASYAFKTQNCQNIKLLGNGAPGVKYGFAIDGGNIGITMDDLSSDFEIANVEVRNSGFAGIMAKTDPSCDVATQRGHFTMSNVSLHDNYIHKTGGEGIYVGNSFYADGVSASCGRVLPHDVANVKVYNNQVDSTGCEGIQLGSATSGCQIYNNTVEYPGRSPFAAGQNNGIQLGEGTGGKCYNNLIKNAPGNGIILLGLGDNELFNNIIINSGENGIFADSRYTPGPGYQFVNNTIISSAADGIKINSETIPMHTVINNVIVRSGTGVAIHRKNNAVKLTSSNNYTGTDIEALKLINYLTGDFHLLSSSPLINAGANTSAYGVTVDYYGKARPSGAAYDIGAVEY